MTLRPLAVALLLTTFAAPALAQTATPAPTESPAAAPAEAPAVADIWLGAEDAPLTIIEYASFTCGHCATFHAESFPKLKAEYIDTGKVRFAQRDVYFDAPGLWAGILARCGGDDRFYAIGGMLMDEQKTWLAAKTGEEYAANLRVIGRKAGLTDPQMDACWNDTARADALVAAYQANATADDIKATPTLVIGGETVPNQSWEQLKAIIDAKLAG